jgi:glutaredoxin
VGDDMIYISILTRVYSWIRFNLLGDQVCPYCGMEISGENTSGWQNYHLRFNCPYCKKITKIINTYE